MASRGSSAQNKGKAFERDVAHLIQKYFKVKARRTPSAERWKITNTGDVNAERGTVLDRFHIEAKHHNTVKIKEWFRKATDDANGYRVPLVVFKIPNTSDVLVTMSYEELLKVLLELNGYLND